MRLSQITEAISPEQIRSVLDSPDPAAGAKALLRAQADLSRRPDMAQRTADMVAQVDRVAVIRDQKRLRTELEKILWAWLLSLGGLTTGTPTERTGKGVAYRRSR